MELGKPGTGGESQAEKATARKSSRSKRQGQEAAVGARGSCRCKVGGSCRCWEKQQKWEKGLGWCVGCQGLKPGQGTNQENSREAAGARGSCGFWVREKSRELGEAAGARKNWELGWRASWEAKEAAGARGNQELDQGEAGNSGSGGERKWRGSWRGGARE